jgi:hypothetical protein
MSDLTAIEWTDHTFSLSTSQTCIHQIGSWTSWRSVVVAGAAIRRQAAKREPEPASQSVCTDASHDDRGGSSAHRSQKAACYGR